MVRRIFSAGVVSLVLAAVGTLSAHHNMAAVFDFDQRFTVTGMLSRLDWRNPHISLSVDVTSDQSQMGTWAFEGPNPGFFHTRNVTKAHFTSALNMTVTVEASRARDGSRSGLIRLITLPSGTVVSLCPQNC
jgi:hypothetical protein